MSAHTSAPTVMSKGKDIFIFVNIKILVFAIGHVLVSLQFSLKRNFQPFSREKNERKEFSNLRECRREVTATQQSQI